MNNKINKIKINVNKINLSASYIQILHNLFDVNYMYSRSLIPQQSNKTISYHFQVNKDNRSISYLVLNPTDIQTLNEIDVNDLLNNFLIQFYNYNLNKECFIIIETTINGFTSNTKKNIKSNIENKYELNKFQLKYFNFNINFLFSQSINETFELMLKSLDNNSNKNSSGETESLLETQKDIANSLFSNTNKIKLILSTNNISIADSKILLKENQYQISYIMASLEKFKKETKNNNNNNNSNSNNHNNNENFKETNKSINCFSNNLIK
ncbi:hypothetical protein DICPUDRAFT_78990 [Dictyostelium purpureum]|uniref:Uncharacterized protein n=1 Tax=Dictyostelium purpureum TaxID=5786 RepID=F0ZL82_DICPU|nr:uncharacterized protein DICPUDRAFT_78990 [Dictyostelium purpureum]EGC35313.1 hypothetical protein DICPUDRAFT_78990 [Dictyostelium purpureum]|eukprot:XP_003288180.1 hypothetical protein DICPUDRAFT_78990 [Dictyostelium purpureum]